MGLEVYRGFLNSPTTVSQVSYLPSGLTFRPKVILFQTAPATGIFSFGIMAGNTIGADCANTLQDAVNTANTFRGGDDTRVIHGINTSAAIRFSAAPISLDANGFTLNWTVVHTATQLIRFTCLGGDAITNATVGTFSVNNATGIESEVGLAFSPDCVLVFGTGVSGSQTSEGYFNIAVANRAGEAVGMHHYSDDGAGATNATSLASTSRWIFVLGTSDDVTVSAEFVTMTADGFTWNRTINGGSRTYFYLALQGVGLRFKIGQITQPTELGTQQVGGFGFPPMYSFFFSDGKAASANASASIRGSIGQAVGGATVGPNTSSEQCRISFADDDAADPTNTAAGGDASNVLMTHDADGTVQNSANLESHDMDGLTLDWTTVDATQRILNYLSMGVVLPLWGRQWPYRSVWGSKHNVGAW